MPYSSCMEIDCRCLAIDLGKIYCNYCFLIIYVFFFVANIISSIGEISSLRLLWYSTIKATNFILYYHECLFY